MTRGDLHIHTRYSDGSYDYREALLLARERGLAFVSFTDHDTVEGVPEALRLGLELGVTVIPGVEISAWDYKRNRKVHILGYGFEPGAPRIRALCSPLLAARHANTLAQLEALRASGVSIGHSDLERAARDSAVYHKQHLMKALVDAGIADGFYGAVFKRLFKESGPAAFDIDYVDAFDAVRAVTADGGIPVLAHPAEYDSWDLVPDLVEAGLRGIELFHETHKGDDHERVINLARSHSLMLTGGSDDHGALGSAVHIGYVPAPADLPTALLARDHPAMGEVLHLVIEAGAKLRVAAAELGGAGADGGVASKGGDHRDLVTEWDGRIESFLVAGLSAAFPGSVFIGEEQAEGAGWVGDGPPPGRAWILDPIDGTTNFADTGRDYAVCIAMLVDGRPELAVVLDCERDRLYTAVAGKGAKVDGRPLRLAPTAASTGAHGGALREALVEISLNSIEYLSGLGADFGYLNREIRGHRAVGSAALGICRIAEGAIGAYVSGKLGIWDWAAADLILREAGGKSWLGPARLAATEADVAERGASNGAAVGGDKAYGSGGVRDKRFYLAAASVSLGESLLDSLSKGEFRKAIRPS